MFSKRFKMAVLLFSAVSIFHMFLSCLSAYAANFDIQPVRIELNGKSRLGKLSIHNVSDIEFPIQVRAYEWSQNEKGEDVYKETQDIIIFPKIMTIAKNEERFIRIGSNVLPGAKEKTYRIYIEEMPSATTIKEGANIRLFMKVGVPVFITPIKTEDKADIEKISINGGKVELKVKNSGNSHFIVTAINLSGLDSGGQAPFKKEIGGWYLLSGTEKVYETTVPIDTCNTITQLNIELKTSKQTIKTEFPMDKSMCNAPVDTAINR
jgi:fimbrial chaperone protein